MDSGVVLLGFGTTRHAGATSLSIAILRRSHAFLTGDHFVAEYFLTVNTLSVNYGLDLYHFGRSFGSLHSSSRLHLKLKKTVAFLLLLVLQLLEKVGFLLFLQLSLGLLADFLHAFFLDTLAGHGFVALLLALDLAVYRVLVL